MNGLKSSLIVCCLVLLLVLSFSAAVSAFAPQPEPPKEIQVLVDGSPLVLDVAPIIREGRTLVPMRAIFESQGASVRWDPADQSIFAQKGGITIKLQIGSDQALVNGLPVKLDAAPIIYEGRTMGPARFISESLGAGVEWDTASQAVIISTKIKQSLEPLPEEEPGALDDDLTEPLGADAPINDSLKRTPVLQIARNYTLTLEATQVDLSGSTRADFGGRLTYTSNLSSTPAAASNKEIKIYKLNGTQIISMGTATTNSQGSYSYSLVTSENGTFVAVFKGEDGQDLAASGSVDVIVKKINTLPRIPGPVLLH